MTPVGPFDRRATGFADGDHGLFARIFDIAAKRQWPWLGRAVQVQRRFGELRGNQLAAAVTLQCFVAVFPLLLAGIAIAGLVTTHSADFPQRVINTLGLRGPSAETMRTTLATAARSRRVTGVVSVAGLLWTGLGVVTALRSVCDQCWQVDERGWRDKIVGLGWLAGIAVAFVVAQVDPTGGAAACLSPLPLRSIADKTMR